MVATLGSIILCASEPFADHSMMMEMTPSVVMENLAITYEFSLSLARVTLVGWKQPWGQRCVAGV